MDCLAFEIGQAVRKKIGVSEVPHGPPTPACPAWDDDASWFGGSPLRNQLGITQICSIVLYQMFPFS